MRGLAIGLAVSATLLASELASVADVTVTEAPPRRSAVSLPLLSVSGFAGIAGQYERQLSNPRWSVVLGAGTRSNAGGDYSSTALSTGAELRIWLKGRAVWSDLPPRSMIGWFAGARLDASWTRTVDAVDDRSLGSSYAFAQTLSFGYRFAIRRRVEITPSIAIGSKTEIPTGRLPAWTRGIGRLGLTVGWLY